MSIYPDFSANNYQVIEQINHNVEGGRTTYKAIEIGTQTPVIIKQFRFATTSNWDSYKAIEREIEVLQGLNHPGIPKYLTKFDPGDGLCLVQEYKNAQSLSTSRSFSPEEIKSIAVQLLEILVYLQEERIPPIFHQDIKPENVLVDDNIKTYLIDFGLARISSNTMALSSMMGGTMGFMPPEQIRNLKPSEASDLYSLGATLICLITRTKSIDIGNLVDFDSNKFTFKDKVPKFSFRFIQWLEKMVEPNPANRYPNAKLALEALQPLYVIRVPEVSLEKTELEVIATKVGEQITQSIMVKNNIPETILQGQWSILPHPNDPPHNPDSHAWIRCFPRQFKGNEVNCKITVDTSQLKADKSYQREIVLHSNATQMTRYLKIKVKTAKLNFDVLFPPYLSVFLLLISLALFSGFLSYGWVITGTEIQNIVSTYISKFPEFFASGENFGTTVGMNIGRVIGTFILLTVGGYIFSFLGRYGILIGVTLGGILGWQIGGGIGANIGVTIGGPIGIVFWSIIGLVVGFILSINLFGLTKAFNVINDIMLEQFINQGFKQKRAMIYITLTLMTGILTGVGLIAGFHQYLIMGLTASTLPLIGMLLYPPLKLRQLKLQYRRQESNNLIDS